MRPPGRVDWSVSAFSRLRAISACSSSGRSRPGAPVRIDGTHPRFTMIGGDFETVRGEWGIRGEVAAFVRDNFQSSALSRPEGSSFDAGVGVDRRAGNYRISGTVLFHHEADRPAESGETPLRSVVGDFGGPALLARALRGAGVRRRQHLGGLGLCAR